MGGGDGEVLVGGDAVCIHVNGVRTKENHYLNSHISYPFTAVVDAG